MKRLLCLILRHRRGATLYRYIRYPKEIAQNVAQRPQTRFRETRFVCARCGRDVEKV